MVELFGKREHMLSGLVIKAILARHPHLLIFFSTVSLALISVVSACAAMAFPSRLMVSISIRAFASRAFSRPP